MNTEDILHMARESGMYQILGQHASEYGSGTFEDTPYPELEDFARLVAAAEREAVINVCEKWAKAGADYSLLEAIRARGNHD